MAKTKKKKAVKKTVKKPVKKMAKKAVAKKVKTKKVVKKTANKSARKKAVAKKLTKATPSKVIQKKIDLTDFITPLDDRLIVQTSATEKITLGGLYIPDTVVDSSGNLQGTVIAVGRGRRNKKGLVRPMDVQVGDKVIFAQYAGSKLNYQNEDLIILREAEVMGIVNQ